MECQPAAQWNIHFLALNEFGMKNSQDTLFNSPDRIYSSCHRHFFNHAVTTSITPGAPLSFTAVTDGVGSRSHFGNLYFTPGDMHKCGARVGAGPRWWETDSASRAGGPSAPHPEATAENTESGEQCSGAAVLPGSYRLVSCCDWRGVLKNRRKAGVGPELFVWRTGAERIRAGWAHVMREECTPDTSNFKRQWRVLTCGTNSKRRLFLAFFYSTWKRRIFPLQFWGAIFLHLAALLVSYRRQ